MKLKEFLQNDGRIASNLGTNTFKVTINKEETKTPHYIMERVRDMLDNRPSLAAGLNSLVLFVLNEIKFTSQDEASAKFANQWLSMRPELYDEITNWTKLLLACGTAYFEPVYQTKVTGEKVLDMLYAVQDSSLIYINLDSDGYNDYYIMQVPREVRTYKGKNPKMWPVYYVNGASFFHRMIYGISFSKDELIQSKFGLSKSPWYGFGLLAPAIDNDEVINEILKNWALIAKYRSLGKKIIGVYNTNGEKVSIQELEDLREMLNNIEEEDSIIINKKFTSEDLSFSNVDNLMNAEMDYTRREAGSTLVPNYMTAFSQDSSLATASEAKIPFSLQLRYLQNFVSHQLNSIITERLKQAYSFLSQDLKLSLSPAELYNLQERFSVVRDCYHNHAATLNELRKAAGLEPIEGGDVWEGDEVKQAKTPKSERYSHKFEEQLLKPKEYSEPVIKVDTTTFNQSKKEKFQSVTKKLLG